MFLDVAVKLQRVHPILKSDDCAPVDLPIVDATQIFGGRALTMTGMGKFIENVRTVFPFILGSCFILPYSITGLLGLMPVSPPSGLPHTINFVKLLQYWQEQRTFLATWAFDKH